MIVNHKIKIVNDQFNVNHKGYLVYMKRGGLMKVLLSRQAKQFDSPLFILKSFLAIMTGYVLFHNHSIVGKDMISVLFGIMLSMEPVSVSGFKSGFSQIKATIIGGTISAIIIYFGGINYITVPLAVAATIYVTLLMDWKNISIIAIFTAVYMTQYVQYNSMNEVSIGLTFQLRMLAVFSGVFVAVVYNFIFSRLFYKGLVRKRTQYLIEELKNNFELYLENKLAYEDLKNVLTTTFVDVDLIKGNIKNLQREKKDSNYLKTYLAVVIELRNINHYLMDLVLNETEVEDKQILKVVKSLDQMAGLNENADEAAKAIESSAIENNQLLKIIKGVNRSTHLLKGVKNGSN